MKQLQWYCFQKKAVRLQQMKFQTKSIKGDYSLGLQIKNQFRLIKFYKEQS